jgi:uncharacterized protein YndB with AHSA1/START domain
VSEPSFVYETVIATTPERLWEALTSGEVTRAYWFDRRVESEWRVGAPVRFHIGDGAEVSDGGEVLECDPPRRLAYTFAQLTDGVPGPVTRVRFELEPVAGGVRMLLVHDELAAPGDVEGWRRGWTPILANLQALLEGRAPESAPARAHRLQDAPPTLTWHIPRPPADVFDALTDPDAVARWWRPTGASTVVEALDAREGGAFALTVTLEGGQVVRLRGTYRQVDRPGVLAHTFRAEGDPMETVVTWRLTPDGAGTLLELIETGIDEDYRRASRDGWAAGVDQLVALLAAAPAR